MAKCIVHVLCVFTKSDFIKCLSQGKGQSGGYEQLNADTALSDVVAMIQINDAKSVKAYGEYSKTEIGDKV